MYREHDKTALHRHKAAQTAVGALQFLADKAVANAVHAGAIVAFERTAKQAEFGDLGYQFAWKSMLLESFPHHRDCLFVDIARDAVLHHAFFFGQLVAVGGFASSLTRNQLVSFMLTLVILLVLGVLLPFIVDVGAAASAGERSAFGAALDWVATGRHTERMLTGLVDTADVAYFAIVTTGFLLMTRTAVESVRWR